MNSSSVLATAQWVSGQSVEKFLDSFFRREGFEIDFVTAHEERVLYLGDRKFTKDGKSYFVEYKSGIQTFYTGNVFLETVSVDSDNRPGWVYTCQADFIAYGAILNKKILIFTPDKLRLEIERLKSRFPEVKTGKNQNKGYNTHGVIVPLDYAEKNLSEKVFTWR